MMDREIFAQWVAQRKTRIGWGKAIAGAIKTWRARGRFDFAGYIATAAKGV
jgi:hypothetical protein